MRTRQLAIIAGPVLAALVFLVLPGEFVDSGGVRTELTVAARGTLGLAAWMALWWLTEAIPVSATAPKG